MHGAITLRLKASQQFGGNELTAAFTGSADEKGSDRTEGKCPFRRGVEGPSEFYLAGSIAFLGAGNFPFVIAAKSLIFSIPSQPEPGEWGSEHLKSTLNADEMQMKKHSNLNGEHSWLHIEPQQCSPFINHSTSQPSSNHYCNRFPLLPLILLCK